MTKSCGLCSKGTPHRHEGNPSIMARVVKVDHRHTCSLCGSGAHPADRFCRSCGASFVNGGSYGT